MIQCHFGTMELHVRIMELHFRIMELHFGIMLVHFGTPFSYSGTPFQYNGVPFWYVLPIVHPGTSLSAQGNHDQTIFRNALQHPGTAITAETAGESFKNLEIRPRVDQYLVQLGDNNAFPSPTTLSPPNLPLKSLRKVENVSTSVQRPSFFYTSQPVKKDSGT